MNLYKDLTGKSNCFKRKEKGKTGPRSHARIPNPPPKRVRLTKKLGYETRKFLNHLDFLFTMGRSEFDFDETKRQTWDDLCALRAHWNTWWDQEKERIHGKVRKR